MKVGVGLPAMVPGRDGPSIAAWAQAAEERGFSTLAVNDVLLSDNFEPLVTLAAAAAVTRTIRLLTSILIAPLHANVPLLAKQTATLDVLSGGRLSLGVAVGPRRRDYECSGVDFERRGRLLDEALERLRELWSDPESELGPRPCQPGGPELLLGASGPAAMRRLERVGEGYISGYGPPKRFRELAERAEEAWARGGRAGTMRKLVLVHFALGPQGLAHAERYVAAHEVVFAGNAERVLAAVALDEEAVGRVVDTFAQIGCDELLFMPCASDVEQLTLLSAALARVESAIHR